MLTRSSNPTKSSKFSSNQGSQQMLNLIIPNKKQEESKSVTKNLTYQNADKTNFKITKP